VAAMLWRVLPQRFDSVGFGGTSQADTHLKKEKSISQRVFMTDQGFIELDIADIDILAGIDSIESASLIAVFFHQQGVFSRLVPFEPEISKLIGLLTFFAAVSSG
jgi:hypothetical protein